MRLRLACALVLTQCALACEGRQLTIFDVSVAGTAGSETASGGTDAGNGDVAGTSGTMAVAGADGGSLSAGGTGGAFGSAGTSGASQVGGGGTGGDGLGGGSFAGSGQGDGTSGSFGNPCASDADCMGWQCDFPDCEATTGFCVPPPACFRGDLRPVCGCDGITYWNDCIRVQAHARPAVRDQCFATALPCGVGSDCNTAGSGLVASCSHLLMCGPGVGSCWVLPAKCDPTLDPKSWRECTPPGSPPGPCRDTCSAIETERPHVPLRPGDTCGN
jgi:hypothetical protein